MIDRFSAIVEMLNCMCIRSQHLCSSSSNEGQRSGCEEGRERFLCLQAHPHESLQSLVIGRKTYMRVTKSDQKVSDSTRLGMSGIHGSISGVKQ